MTNVVLVGLGGFLGTVLRFLIYQLKLHQLFPLSTLVINLFGSFLIGLMLSSPLAKTGSNTYQVLVVGVLGGFTTYSAFSGETLSLLLKNQALTAITYVLATMLGGLLCCTLGFLLSKAIWE